jgi:hypothetical protein
MLAWAVALAGAAAVPAGAQDRPDLVIRMPAEPYGDQVAPVYVDRFTEPGRVLYRFDAIVENRGGTLDVFRDGEARPATQAVWDGGRPPPGAEPDPAVPPVPGDGVTLEDRSAAGASFSYAVEPDHAHWHFARIAGYELLVPGQPARASDKVGFCFFDGFDTGGPSNYFPEPDWGSGDPTWCAFDEPDAAFVRMGLSPGASDRYRSQRHFQWVDVAGLAAGTYTLRGTANPAGFVLESDGSNNVVEEPRLVPGAAAFPATADTARGTPVVLDLLGAVVGPGIPARRAATCQPAPDSQDCYLRADAGGPLGFDVVDPPDGGTVTVERVAGTAAAVRYTPAPGFGGRDRFEYTTTDERGLTSVPAAVTVTVRDPAGPRPRLKPIAGVALRRVGRRWHVVLRLRTAASVRGVVRRRGRSMRRLRPRLLRPGRRRIGLGRLRRPGRHALLLRASTADDSQRIVLRFRVRP